MYQYIINFDTSETWLNPQEPAHKLLQGHTPFQYRVSMVFQLKQML